MTVTVQSLDPNRISKKDTGARGTCVQISVFSTFKAIFYVLVKTCLDKGKDKYMYRVGSSTGEGLVVWKSTSAHS